MGKAASVIIGAVVAVATGGIGAVIAGSAFSVATAVSTFAGSLILGGLSYALSPKPPKANVPSDSPSQAASVSQINNTTVAVRQPDLTRQIVYGHTRITRGYAHMESTGLNGKLHMILILCEGTLRSINEIWVNDKCIPPDWIDGEGNVTQGPYSGKLQIRKHLGTETQTADTLAVSNMPTWTNSHRLQGIAYLYIILTKDQDVYPNGVPNFSAIVEGPTVYDPREEGQIWSTNLALFSRDFIRNDVYGFGANAEDVDEVNVAAQANICDEIVDTVGPSFTITNVNTGSNILTLSGDLLQYQFGDRVRVTTTGTLPTGIEPDTDYYVIPYQIKTSPRILLASSLADAMAKNAIDVSSSGSGTITIDKTGEPRYHGGGVVDTDTGLSETLNNLVTAMAGRAINSGGFWTLLAGAWRTPVLDLGIGDMTGSGMSFKNALSMSESYNGVKGLFVSSLNYYQPTDYPMATYPQFVDADLDKESVKNLNLPFSNRPTTAQRIAKIELFRGRQDIAFSADFKTMALVLEPGDVVTLTIDRYGWSQKPFEVTQFILDIQNDKIVARLTLRETAQQIYDWSDGEAIDFDPAPNTNLPNPLDVLEPTSVSYNSRFIETRDGDAVYAIVLNWDLHPDAFVREFGDFEIQYKLSAEPNFRPSFFVDGHLTTTDVLNSSVNVQYDLRIRARNSLGVRSDWVTILQAVVGSSGGVVDTRDYEHVYDPIGSSDFYDYGSVADPVGSGEEEDWGFVV